MQFIIGGIKKTSLLDYPNKICAIVFTQGCNFNCGYCHNPSLLEYKSKNNIYDIDVFFDFLKNRKGKLDGVVITGGEPTLQKDLKLFISKIKEMDFSVKLDTNGYNPNILENLIAEKLIDYIAMDIKGPLEKYSFITNRNIDTSKIKKSIDLIMNSNIDYEFRTTVLPIFLKKEDFLAIGKLINSAKKYYIQKFVVQSEINNQNLISEQNYTQQDLEEIIKIISQYVKEAEVRY